METVTIHAKTTITDSYGDVIDGGYNPTAAMALAALVAPNNDPTRIAVGRVDVPVRFDIFIPGGLPNGIDPELHVATIRGSVYDIDGSSEEWQFMQGAHAGDHFTVTALTDVAASNSSSSSS